MRSWKSIAGIQGVYMSPILDISTSDKVRRTDIIWTDNSDEFKIITVKTSVSTDGGETWSSWKTPVNNGEIPDIPIGTNLSNGRMQFKIIFSTEDILLNPELYSITIKINGVSIYLYEDSILTYNQIIPEDFTINFYIRLPSDYSGVFLSLGDIYKVGYDGNRFFYENNYRLTAGSLRELPTTDFLVGIKPDRILIKTDDYQEIIK